MFNQKYDFCIENSANYFIEKLSICLRAHGFSFSMHDSKHNLIRLADFDAFFPERLSESMSLLRDAFACLNIRTFGYPSISTIFQINKHVWIPDALYDENHTKEYLQFVCHINANEQLHTCYSKTLNAHSIFVIDQNMYSVFKVLMPTTSFCSQHIVMAEKGMELAEKQNDTLLVNIREKAIDIVAYRKKEFVFGNSFAFEEQNEITYFILNVIKQLQFNPSTTKCFVGGNFDDTLLYTLKSFIYHTEPYFSSPENELGIERVNLAKYFMVL